MPRRSNAEAAQTRAAIVDRAVETASVEGLEGVTIGKLADDLGLSKAGVIGHFGTKVELQREALHRAQAIFTAEVWEPARDKPGGLPVSWRSATTGSRTWPTARSLAAAS